MIAQAPRPARALLVALVAAAAALTGCLFAPDETRAARNLELAIQDDPLFLSGHENFPGDESYEYARALGVTRIRVNLLWSYSMLPENYTARRKPSEITYDFSQTDRLIDRAAENGIRVHLSLSGPTPRWANARKRIHRKSWYKPNPREYAKWVSVVAKHFKGRVDRYSIWNEPNWKTWLGPLDAAPTIYRQMYVLGYRAIKRADSRAAVLIGETAPYDRPGLATSPIAFLRKLTCVNKKYKRTRSCPKLKADGYAHHPYDLLHSPSFQYPGEDDVTIGTLPRLTRALDKLSKAGVLRYTRGGRMPIYLTEYGYFASGKRALPKSKRTRYLQQAYSIALKNKRVKSQLQYLLLTLPPDSTSTFNTGIVTPRGKRLPQYKALRRWYQVNRGKVKRPGSGFTLPPARPNPRG